MTGALCSTYLSTTVNLPVLQFIARIQEWRNKIYVWLQRYAKIFQIRIYTEGWPPFLTIWVPPFLTIWVRHFLGRCKCDRTARSYCNSLTNAQRRHCYGRRRILSNNCAMQICIASKLVDYTKGHLWRRRLRPDVFACFSFFILTLDFLSVEDVFAGSAIFSSLLAFYWRHHSVTCIYFFFWTNSTCVEDLGQIYSGGFFLSWCHLYLCSRSFTF